MSAQAPAEARVMLGPTCTIRESAAMRADLLRAMDAPAVRIDAASVAKIDTAGLQLLVAFVRDRARHDLATQWGDVAPPLREGAERLGLTGSLNLPSAAD